MGLFDFLFGTKKQSERKAVSIKRVDYHTPQYFKLLESEPKLSKIWGRDYDFPSYDDSFITEEGYKLRELLLLIWWGKTKSGRKSTATIPKYFFLTYNLNAEKLTSVFKTAGLLIDSDDRTFLTENGRAMFDKYQSLWEIHSVKNYPTNLDSDFPTWNKEKFALKLYQMEFRYYKAHANHCKKMIEFFNSFNVPFPNQDIHNEINYYINERNSDLANVNDFQEKIGILKEKSSTGEISKS